MTGWLKVRSLQHIAKQSYANAQLDLNDQNMFNSTIDAPSGVPEVSKNPNHQTVVHSGELEHYDSAKIEETVKNHQNWTKIVKGTLFSEVFGISFY